jgi:hypothetical protein
MALDVGTEVGTLIEVIEVRADSTTATVGVPTFVQQTRPTIPGPWTWWQTDANGVILDLFIEPAS